MMKQPASLYGLGIPPAQYRALAADSPQGIGAVLSGRLERLACGFDTVGISNLVIHLCKGQTLILWDEIKEVRPFRFLHVRNLLLIKETGEKTRMHWTPLERHSDLKAAVEGFAPANHPLRKYLSLLRHT